MSVVLERELLIAGIVEGAGSGRRGAEILGISESLLSKIGAGSRSIAEDLKPKIAGMSFKSAIAIIIENTGFRGLFGYFTKDRHPQNLIRTIKREDEQADEAIERLADRLVDKPGDEDLTDEDTAEIRMNVKEIADRVRADINLLAELDSRYPRLKIRELFIDKEKSPSKATCNISYK